MNLIERTFITLNIIRQIFEYIFILLLTTVIQRYFNFSMEVLILAGIFLFLIKK